MGTVDLETALQLVFGGVLGGLGILLVIALGYIGKAILTRTIRWWDRLQERRLDRYIQSHESRLQALKKFEENE